MTPARTRVLRTLRLGATTLTALAMVSATVAAAPAASAETAPASYPAVLDTFVSASSPTKSYGSSSGMTVDASPQREALLRFDLSAIDGTITGATLRMYSTDSSPEGGRVFRTSSTWTERTTWNTRPALETELLASFGSVTSGRWYDVPLADGAVTAGVVSFGISSPSGNGARWSTRETTNRPVLLVTVAETTSEPAPQPAPEPEPDGTTVDGLSAVAGPGVGSSEPTYYTGNSRLAVTKGGRLLALHGKHRSGVQVTWRDPAGTWQTASTGASSVGELLSGTGTGDWPASIAVATAPDGAEHAWVVWSGPGSVSLRPVQMRRLSNLDSAAGPHLGPIVTIDAPAQGAYRADIAFERDANGVVRGCVLYSRQVADYTYELTAVWFTDLTTDTPVFGNRAVLATWANRHQYGSLVPSDAGLRAVARTGSKTPQLQLYLRSSSAALTSWTKGLTGPSVPYGASPSGIALASGEIVAAFEDDLTNHVSQVYRFSADGTSGGVLRRQSGLAQPSVVRSSTGATLVAVRFSDGAIVSRAWSPTAGWSSSDTLEVSPADTGRLAWPNVLRQADGRLRLLAEGPGTTTSTSSVWAFQRLL